MNLYPRLVVCSGAGMLMCVLPLSLRAQEPVTNKESKVEHKVHGEFDVKLGVVDTGDKQLGMMTLDKAYHGELEAKSVGRMLTAMSEVKGSGVYVAVERVTGKLRGAEGSFMLHHTGTMAGGKQSLSIKVVPDSGTGALQGIQGDMDIEIKDGKHFYRFTYELLR